MSSEDNKNLNEETQSTIFSDPAFYNESSDKGDRKNGGHPMLTKIVACLLAVALLGGALAAAIKFIPEIVEDGDSQNTKISVTEMSENEVSSIEIDNEKGKIKFNANLSEKDGKSVVEWSVEGVDSALTSSNSISTLAANVLKLSATDKLAFSEGFGFDKAPIIVKVNAKSEDKNYTLTFGDSAPAELGIYCKLSTDAENIYVIPNETVLALQCVATDFAVTTGYSGIPVTSETSSSISQGQIINFDYLNVSGEKWGKDNLRIVLQDDESVNAFFAYKTLSPRVHVADDTAVESITSLFANGITSGGAYAFSADNDTLKKYRLDKPDFVVTLSIAKKEYTLKFSVIDENFVAMYDGEKPMIHKVPISSVPFVNTKITDYYSSFIVLENLSGLTGLKVEVLGDTTYDFDLKFTAGEDSSKDTYEAFYGGKELDIQKFKDYYKILVGMSPVSYESQSGLKTATRITFKHSADIPDTVLEFRPYSSLKYQVEISGTPIGLITKMVYDEFLDATKQIINETK